MTTYKRRDFKYICSACEVDVGRDSLLAKRVQFTTFGRGARPVRSRIVAWICMDCAEKDPDWTSEPWVDGPYLKDVTRDAAS